MIDAILTYNQRQYWRILELIDAYESGAIALRKLINSTNRFGTNN